MKKAISNLCAGIGIILVYMILGYIHSKQLQSPTYVINLIIQSKNIAGAFVWTFGFAIALAAIMLGIIAIIKQIVAKLSKKGQAL